jgi:hypothetical protein
MAEKVAVVGPGDDDFIDYEDDDDARSACSCCGGDGGDPGNDYVLPCPVCDGEGWVPHE